jgi:formate dehydrogenase maturation protein FdhE
MRLSDSDLQVLRALEAARERHEGLAELLDFYHDLFDVQFQAKAEAPDPELRDEMAMRWRLEGGIPQLTFDQLGLDGEPFAQLVSQVAAVLLRHNPTWQAEWEHWSPAELLAQARRIFETWDTLTAPKANSTHEGYDEAWTGHAMALAVGFALAPYLQRASDTILPHLDLTLWAQNYCPICGGRPNFAVLEETRGARQLMCSRCNSLWSYRRVGCPFCQTQEQQKYYPSEDGVYRLYVCVTCNRYLKTIDLRGVHRQVYPVIERLLTVGMDLAAQQEGYGG